MSTSSVESSGFTNKMRIGGLTSGLDTDSMITELMNAERIPLTKLEQKKQVVEWKQEEYRDVTNSMRAFKDTYFNTLEPDTNMTKLNTYKQFESTTTDSAVVKAEGGSGATAGAHTVTVNSIATSAVALTNSLSGSFSGSTAMTTGAASDVVDASGKNLKITIDGVSREVTLGIFTDASTVSDVAADIESKINSAFGGTKISASESGGVLTMDNTGGATVISIASASTDDVASFLHYEAGDSNTISTNATLSQIAANGGTGLTLVGDEVEFTINDATFTFSGDTSLSSMMGEINSDSDAGVYIAYDQVTDKLRMTAKQMGAGDSINISSTTGSFFTSATTDGVDASVVIDGETLTRSSNYASVNGVTYTFIEADPGVEKTISLNSNIDEVFSKITDFIDSYNGLVATLNSKLTEKRDRSYQPLTQAQKDSMTDDEITRWEVKAKEGLLKNDSILSSMIVDIRRAIFDPIEGVSGSLAEIGIDTGSYTDKGKLTIDENALKEALRSDTDKVMNLFSKQSTTESRYKRTLDSSQRSDRYNEEGFVQRISDIMEDNISTSMDGNGLKGMLLEKAGIANDTSEYTNIIFDQIKAYEKSIERFTRMLESKEESYYQKFANLETAMNRMNSQSSWLSQQMGG